MYSADGANVSPAHSWSDTPIDGATNFSEDCWMPPTDFANRHLFSVKISLPDGNIIDYRNNSNNCHCNLVVSRDFFFVVLFCIAFEKYCRQYCWQMDRWYLSMGNWEGYSKFCDRGCLYSSTVLLVTTKFIAGQCAHYKQTHTDTQIHKKNSFIDSFLFIGKRS